MGRKGAHLWPPPLAAVPDCWASRGHPARLEGSLMPASQVLWRARTVPEAMESSVCRPCRGWAKVSRAEATRRRGRPWQAGRGRCWWPAPQGRRVRMNCGPGRPAEIRLAAEESRDHIPSATRATDDGMGRGRGLASQASPATPVSQCPSHEV